MELKTAAGTFNVQVDGPHGAPWLVLSHSLGSTLNMWTPQVAPFAQRFRVLRYDTRGHGRSVVPTGDYSMADLGSDVLRLLDAVDAERVVFCGLSMGGATALWLATHAAERLSHVVVCNSVPWLGPPEVLTARIATVREHGLAALVDATMERWFTPEFRTESPDVVARVRTEFLATPVDGYVGCLAALRRHDERGNLSRIDLPVLVIAGQHDVSPPPANAREFASQVPNAHFVELPAAHLSNLGAAEAFDEAVMGFLGSG
jgi:3-oxoadipate enol-lactonase